MVGDITVDKRDLCGAKNTAVCSMKRVTQIGWLGENWQKIILIQNHDFSAQRNSIFDPGDFGCDVGFGQCSLELLSQVYDGFALQNWITRDACRELN